MKWLWLALHVLGLAACAVFGPDVAFAPYLGIFLAAELLGILLGHPMTRYVRAWLKETRPSPVAGAVSVLVVALWIATFVILCVNYGPFVPGVNAFVAVLPLAGWLVPHFHGDRW